MTKSDKSVDLVQFVQTFIKAAQSDTSNRFSTFRWDSPSVGGYVLDHAYSLWQAHYDKWDTVEAFALNYVRCVELGTQDELSKLVRWRKHGELVRDLLIGG